jgi:hypothetical protein
MAKKKTVPLKKSKKATSKVADKGSPKKYKVDTTHAGNEWWKLRAKHGRDKLFATPELLWEAACEYFNYVDARPFKKVDFKGGFAKRVEIPLQRPYTIQGLCLYLDCGVEYFRCFKRDLKIDDPQRADFLRVVAQIEETIYAQKFEGASAGIFSSNIIARDLGLADKQDIDTKVAIQQVTGIEVK